MRGLAILLISFVVALTAIALTPALKGEIVQPYSIEWNEFFNRKVN